MVAIQALLVHYVFCCPDIIMIIVVVIDSCTFECSVPHWNVPRTLWHHADGRISYHPIPNKKLNFDYKGQIDFALDNVPIVISIDGVNLGMPCKGEGFVAQQLSRSHTLDL